MLYRTILNSNRLKSRLLGWKGVTFKFLHLRRWLSASLRFFRLLLRNLWVVHGEGNEVANCFIFLFVVWDQLFGFPHILFIFFCRIHFRGLKWVLWFNSISTFFLSFLLRCLSLLLGLSLLVVLSEVAVLTQAVRVVRLVGVSTGGGHLRFSPLVVTVVAHTFGIRLFVSMGTFHDLRIVVGVDFRPNGLNRVKTAQRVGQDGVLLVADERVAHLWRSWLSQIGL